MGDLRDYAKQVLEERASGTVEPRTAIDHALDETAEAMRREGIVPGDPAWPLMQSLMNVVAALDGITGKYAADLKALVADAKAQTDAEIARLKAASAAIEAESTRRISTGIVEEASQAFRGKVRLDQRKFMVSTIGAAAILILAALVGGYRWGRAVRDGEMVATANGVNVTGVALDLLRANDFDAALRQTMAHGTDPKTGRRWANVPLWLDMPKGQPIIR